MPTPTHMCIYPENLAKIGAVFSEINGLQGDLKKKVTSAHLIARTACQTWAEFIRA